VNVKLRWWWRRWWPENICRVFPLVFPPFHIPVIESRLVFKGRLEAAVKSGKRALLNRQNTSAAAFPATDEHLPPTLATNLPLQIASHQTRLQAVRGHSSTCHLNKLRACKVRIGHAQLIFSEHLTGRGQQKKCNYCYDNTKPWVYNNCYASNSNCMYYAAIRREIWLAV